MLSYKQYCPVAKTAEIFADRWTPLILRELCSLPRSFSDLLEGMPLIPRTTLSLRLKELTAAEVIAAKPKTRGRGYIYRLTPAGEEFRPLIEMMAEWGQRWAYRRIHPEDLDTSALMSAAAWYANAADLPVARIVVRFEFHGIPKVRPSPRYWWWIVKRPEIDVCLKDYGFRVDVEVKADLAVLTKVYLGHIGLAEAMRRKLLTFEGPSPAIATLCRVMDLHEEPKPKKFTYPSREVGVSVPGGLRASANRNAPSRALTTFDA
jgi:DNA-binding HxlR family transcriptional regulator